MTDQAGGAEVVLEMLRERGLRMTPQRRAIVAEIMATDGHISPTDVARRVRGSLRRLRGGGLTASAALRRRTTRTPIARRLPLYRLHGAVPAARCGCIPLLLQYVATKGRLARTTSSSIRRHAEGERGARW